MGKEDEEPLGLNRVSAGQEGVAIAGAGAANARGGLWDRFNGGAASVLLFLILVKARVEKAVEPQSSARQLAGKWAGGEGLARSSPPAPSSLCILFLPLPHPQVPTPAHACCFGNDPASPPLWERLGPKRELRVSGWPSYFAEVGTHSVLCFFGLKYL